MLVDRIAQRLWTVLCTCATILFLLFFWGSPEWVSLFPQGALYRFIDALWFDILLLTLIVIPSLFCFSHHMYNLYVLITGILFLLAFSCSVLFEMRLAVTDTLILIFSWMVLVTLFICAIREAIHTNNNSNASKTSRLFLLWTLLLFPLWLAFSGIEFLFPHLGNLFLIGKGVVMAVGIFIPVRSKSTATYESISREFLVTARELEVLSLVRKGCTNQEIAEALYISVVTVKTHLTHLFEKTNARNRVELLNIMEGKSQNTTLR